MIRHRWNSYVYLLLLLAAVHPLTTSAAAQTSPDVPKLTIRPSQQGAAVPVPIASGDLLSVSVYDSPELTQKVRVEADGVVQLALIGTTKVAGLTALQAADTIAQELQDHNLLLHPQVNVLIEEYSSQGVSVTGEVQHPGVYSVLGSRTLLDVISMAGGLTNTADTNITIRNRSGTEESVSVNLKNDDAKASLANNIQVYPGDLVVVPRAGIVYVLGDVSRPGGFTMQNNGKITLLQALAQAGGTNRSASMNGATLLRKTAEGYVSKQVRIGDLVRGRGEDVELHPSDILYVPNSVLKSVAQSTQAIVTSLGSASVYAAAVH
jgi:polysaccharide export outer membrane protein